MLEEHGIEKSGFLDDEMTDEIKETPFKPEDFPLAELLAESLNERCLSLN